MAWSLGVLLLVASALSVATQDTSQFKTTLYFVNLTEIDNEVNHLTTYVQGQFSSVGTDIEIQAERLGACMKVKVSLKEKDGQEGETVVTSLTETPVNINKFKGGPFQVTSGLNSQLCPQAVPNFHFDFHVFDVAGKVDKSRIEEKVTSHIESVGSGWEYHDKIVGSCLVVYLKAVLTSEEEATVSTSLASLETGGITLTDEGKSVKYNLTSSNEEAKKCYESYKQKDCDEGERMCPYADKCLAESLFCDGKDDCGNMADETNCNFEFYTVRIATSMQYRESTKDLLSKSFSTFFHDKFVLVSNFSHVRFLEVKQNSQNKISLLVKLAFRGLLPADSVTNKLTDVVNSGIEVGMGKLPVTDYQAVNPGACTNKDCGTGVCVETETSGECRCLRGQDPHTCQPLDCRGSETYCTNSSTKCMFTPHLSAYACQCPQGMSGPHCDIKVCSQLGGSVCSMNGQCSGDLYNFRLCTCEELYWGPFCEHRGRGDHLSQCHRHRMLHTEFLKQLQGTERANADLLYGLSASHRLRSLGYHNLHVPECDSTSGDYHHMCVYNVNDTQITVCYCTDADGAYNGLDYVDGVCTEPSPFDRDEKAGVCPPTAEGAMELECRHDSDCAGADKCCRAGSGRVCLAPFTVKGGECPRPQDGMTVRQCESDGDCPDSRKCCPEGTGRLCRPPTYVTRFQLEVTLDAPWKQRYSNINKPSAQQLERNVMEKMEDLAGFQNLTLLSAMNNAEKTQVTMEVVASPDLRHSNISDKLTSLVGLKVGFDSAMRDITSADLVTYQFCGAEGCGSGSCIKTSRGARCLCQTGAYGDACQFLDPCEGGVCQNGGSCESSSRQVENGLVYNYTCHCPPGLIGPTCEVSICDQFPKELCNYGTCVGDLKAGVLCSCPLSYRGMFCDESGTELPYTECELRHRLNSYFGDVLQGQTTMKGLSAEDLQSILQMAMEWLPLVTCRHGGQYELTAELLSVQDASTVRHVCLDTRGKEEVNCQSKTCSALSSEVRGSLCQNGGKCAGNINLMLCNCSGTGHHGALCQLAGEDDLTECEHKHNLAQMTLEALGGNLAVEGLTGMQVQNLISTLLEDIHREKFWQPDCTPGGSHGYRGCEFQVSDTSRKECFCLDQQLNRIDTIPSSTTGLPECPLSGACGEFTSDPCGEYGTCIGDINAGTLCQCQDSYSGLTCQINAVSTQTECQRRSELSNYLLNILHGYEDKPQGLDKSIHQLLTAAGIQRLEVPTCTQETGLYKSICTYSLDPVQLDECRCTNDDGTYMSGDEGSQSCKDLGKPGECPSSDGMMGIAIHECDDDFGCADSLKCCSIGAGNQCRPPVYVTVFRVNVTIDAPWKSSYSNLISSDMTNIQSQLADVFRTLEGYRSVAFFSSRQGSIKLTIDVTASADVTANDIMGAVNRLRAYQITIGDNTHKISQTVTTAHGACVGMDCGTGICVDSSLGSRCLCQPGTSGERCQRIMQPCNCTIGQQCLRGAHSDALACSCFPENDASCKVPLWYCEDKADCTGREKCVHSEDCSSLPCQIQSRCIPVAEEHQCDDQPCQHGGTCVVDNTGKYKCRCKQGFSGLKCERNVAVCQLVPSKVCPGACVGDAHVGVLCQCPHGRGGLSCDRPAHSQCERQHAFYSDMLKIQRRELNIPGFTKTQLYNMMHDIMQHIQASSIPLVSCTSDGNFAPVQCRLNLTTQEETCHCVNKAGVPVDSNVQAYPGFPSCTAPYSPEAMGKMLCSTSLGSVCRNGGKCAGNLLNGTLCQCPSTHSGIFCQTRLGSGQAEEMPNSLCELSREVWIQMSEAVRTNDVNLLTPLQTLQLHLFHVGTQRPDVLIKADCQTDGQFRPVQCSYNLRTNQASHCYCITAKGIVLQSETTWPEQPQCEGIESCPNPACSLTCEHGLARDIHGCPICQCRHPCDGQCEQEEGKRCVVELQEDCGRENWEGTCTSGVCRQRTNSGACPISVSANLTSLNTLKSDAIRSCEAECLDDADCPGQKCCGVCGTQCVNAEGDHSCARHRENALEELAFLKKLQTAMTNGQVKMALASRLVKSQLESLQAKDKVWIPGCNDNNGLYRPTQCYTTVKDRGGDQTEGCFCVNRLGNIIAGTEASTKSQTNCDVKPGTCPFLQPNSSAEHGCQNDYDCSQRLKCCPDGLGSLCVKPIVMQEGDEISLDSLLSNTCRFAATLCGRQGACVKRWYTEGRVCSCNSGWRGPFCQTEGQETNTLTACQRRKQLVNNLINNPDTLDIFIRQARQKSTGAVLKLTFPDCLEDGQFAATQCTKNIDSRQPVDCHCVDRQGGPLSGTDVPAGQTPACARLNPCTIGAPLHHALNDSAVSCGNGRGQCVAGYSCRAGRYGQLYCCRDPTSNIDECQLPASSGNDCQYYDGRQEVSQGRFYYDTISKTCKSVAYKGCTDHKPNFDSKPQCQARCIRKEHTGRCPAKTVVAERTMCMDLCNNDAGCSTDQKCCRSSCGRRCVLSLNNGNAVCEIGQPLLDSNSQQPLQCSSHGDCGAGYHCRNSRCCIKRIDDICQQQKVRGQCTGHHVRYFYNVDSGHCEEFAYSGCGANDNNFHSVDQCCNACGRTGRCKQGVCPAPRPVLSVSCDDSCRGDGDCPANQICCTSSCGGSTCVIPKASMNPKEDCLDELLDYIQQMKKTKDCFLRYRPRCERSGRYERQQCQDKLGICWCVTDTGHVVPNTRVRGVAQCQWVTPVMLELADREGKKGNSQLDEDCPVCQGGGPVQCCNEDLCLQVCASNPLAVCRINPCGGCQAEFFDASNQRVNCEEGSTCQTHHQKSLTARHQYGMIAMATFNRQKHVTPILMTPSNGETQTSFIVDKVPQKCQLMPESGECQALSPQWFYNVTSERCERFVYTLCGGNDNRFLTSDECYQECNSKASPCKTKECSSSEYCKLSHSEDCFTGPCQLTPHCASKLGEFELPGVYVPECTSAGSYSFKQCHGEVCWCVTNDGAFNKAITNRPSSLQCQKSGPTNSNFGKLKCGNSGDSKWDLSCVDQCQTAVCPGYPSAQCVLDICTCQTRFVDHQGRTVNCKADKCDSNVFSKAENKDCGYPNSCGNNNPKNCEYEDPCLTAVCANNPCAVCVSDPCTGQVSYVDALTNTKYHQSDCNTIVHTSCELRRCEMMSHNARANNSDNMLTLPQCGEDGFYNPQQRRHDGSLYCVDAFGQPIDDVLDECYEDRVVNVKVAVTYKGTYDKLVAGREGKVIQAFTEALDKIGIEERMLINIRISETSKGNNVMIECEVVQNSDTPVDLAVVVPLVQFRAATGDLTLKVDGKVMRVLGEDPVLTTPTTSRLQSGEVDSAGLGGGAIAAIVLVFLIGGGVAGGAAFYILSYKRRLANRDNSTERDRVDGVQNKKFDLFTIFSPFKKPSAPPEDFVEEPMENHYVKMRL